MRDEVSVYPVDDAGIDISHLEQRWNLWVPCAARGMRLYCSRSEGSGNHDCKGRFGLMREERIEGGITQRTKASASKNAKADNG